MGVAAVPGSGKTTTIAHLAAGTAGTPEPGAGTSAGGRPGPGGHLPGGRRRRPPGPHRPGPRRPPAAASGVRGAHPPQPGLRHRPDLARARRHRRRGAGPGRALPAGADRPRSRRVERREPAPLGTAGPRRGGPPRPGVGGEMGPHRRRDRPHRDRRRQEPAPGRGRAPRPAGVGRRPRRGRGPAAAAAAHGGRDPRALPAAGRELGGHRLQRHGAPRRRPPRLPRGPGRPARGALDGGPRGRGPGQRAPAGGAPRTPDLRLRPLDPGGRRQPVDHQHLHLRRPPVPAPLPRASGGAHRGDVGLGPLLPEDHGRWPTAWWPGPARPTRSPRSGRRPSAGSAWSRPRPGTRSRTPKTGTAPSPCAPSSTAPRSWPTWPAGPSASPARGRSAPSPCSSPPTVSASRWPRSCGSRASPSTSA